MTSSLFRRPKTPSTKDLLLDIASRSTPLVRPATVAGLWSKWLGPLLVALLAPLTVGATLTAPVTGAELVCLPGGTFLMGDAAGTGRPNERPAHEVSLRPFCITRQEVTVGDFRTFVDATGYRTAAETRGWVLDIDVGMNSWTQVPGISWKNPGFPQSDDHPVTWVDWNDASAFARWLSEVSGMEFGLPAEAEWEFAARGGDKRLPWAGSGSTSELIEYAWFDRNASGRSHRVGEKKPNGFGLHDMSGNVWEWCSDSIGAYGRQPGGLPDDGTRTLRGGSWRVGEPLVTVTYRSAYKIGYSHSSIGFRLVLHQ